MRSRQRKLLGNTLLQLLLCVLLSSSFTSARGSTLLPSPISALLLLKLGRILVTLFNCSELICLLLVIGEVDDSLSTAGFPGHAECANDTL